MGTGDFAAPALTALLDASYRVVGVYTRPDRRSGRGKKLSPTPIKAHALIQGLTVLQPPSLRSREALDELESLSPDVIVVAAYGLILPRRALEQPEHRCLNVHPSLLPAYRGPSPVASAILNGERVTGVTIMEMDEGMDTGPTVAARETAIGPRETAGDLTARLSRMGADLLVETLGAWVNGDVAARPQDESRATVTRRLSKEDGRIDWAKGAGRLALQVRAYGPWPGSFTEMNGKLLKVLEATAAQSDPGAPAGKVLSLPDGRVGVASGAGVLVLHRLQLEGRRPVSASELIRGYPGLVGSRLG